MRTLWRVSCCVVGLGVLAAFPVWALDAQQPTEQSVVEAARAARERLSRSNPPAPVVDNDILPARTPSSASSGYALVPQANAELDVTAADEDCHNPAAAEELRNELQMAQQEREQLERELSEQAPVISDNDLDLRYYQPGASGVYMGAPPLQESQPQAAARVALAALGEKIASLEKSLQLACDPPEAAPSQRNLDAIETELKLSRRELALDQDTVYSNPEYDRAAEGQAQLAAEEQYVQSLEAEKAQLEEELAAIKTNPSNEEGANQEQPAPRAGSTQPQAAKPQPQ